eukprot:Sspe_Gene.91794::Locus_63419_Transcript_1_1_Confidence_1.000_Length_575::g.91794::m.91794
MGDQGIEALFQLFPNVDQHVVRNAWRSAGKNPNEAAAILMSQQSQIESTTGQGGRRTSETSSNGVAQSTRAGGRVEEAKEWFRRRQPLVERFPNHSWEQIDEALNCTATEAEAVAYLDSIQPRPPTSSAPAIARPVPGTPPPTQIRPRELKDLRERLKNIFPDMSSDDINLAI